MKFVRYNSNKVGMLTDDGQGIIDLTDPFDISSPDPLLEFIREGHDAQEHIDSVPDYSVSDVRLESPVKHPENIIAAPANYRLHADEMGAGDRDFEQKYFLKSTSSISGPEDAIVLPFSDRRCDHEIELALLIAEDIKDIDSDEVEDKIFGYTMLLDISVRGDRDRSNRKSYDTFTPLGPVVVTPDEIDDPLDLEMTLEVNGEVRQQAVTRDMVFTHDEIIQYASIGKTISSGDVVTMGTPEGVGELKGGDTVDAEIEEIGSMNLQVEEREDEWDDRVLPSR